MVGFREIFQGGAHPGVHSQLPVDGVDVGLHGVFGDHEAARNLLVVVTIGEQSQNLLLALGELARGLSVRRRLPSPELTDDPSRHTMAHPDFACSHNP